MPLLGNLLVWLGGSIVSILTALVGARIAVRLAAVASLGGIYVSCVLFFSSMVSSWITTLFSSSIYGAVLGLAFPPVSGTVIASLFAYYGCVAGAKYVSSLTKLAIG